MTDKEMLSKMCEIKIGLNEISKSTILSEKMVVFFGYFSLPFPLFMEGRRAKSFRLKSELKVNNIEKLFFFFYDMLVRDWYFLWCVLPPLQFNFTETA